MRKKFRVEVARVRHWDVHGYGKWFWRVVAANGRIVAHSEIYANKSNALRSARRVSKSWDVELIVL